MSVSTEVSAWLKRGLARKLRVAQHNEKLLKRWLDTCSAVDNVTAAPQAKGSKS